MAHASVEWSIDLMGLRRSTQSSEMAQVRDIKNRGGRRTGVHDVLVPGDFEDVCPPSPNGSEHPPGDAIWIG
jgi:hypothetical protein